MLKKTLFWTLSFVITVLFAVFQRMTGPTYPVKDVLVLEDDRTVSFRLPRSCTVKADDCVVTVKPGLSLSGHISWRRYNTDDSWADMDMVYKDGALRALLPDQPPAGKLEYRVFLKQKTGYLELHDKTVITRFKGFVPSFILVPHILFMFFFMLFSVRIFLTVFTGDMPVRHAVVMNVVFLIAGGFILGPITQHHAFGAYWTGWPFGGDLTDNKALAMLIAWVPALWAVLKGRASGRWITAAFVVTAAMCFIPHSLLGSELDYKKGEIITGGR